MGADTGLGGARGAGRGSEGGPPSDAGPSDDGLRGGAASGVGGAPQGLGGPSRSDYGTNQGGAGRLPHAGRVAEPARRGKINPGKSARKARMLKALKYAAHKPRIIYKTICYDPDRLSSRYSQDEIRKMIAEGKVVEVIGRWRKVTRS